MDTQTFIFCCWLPTDMVVSGVPNKTEQHARHVAMMSLEMIQASKDFKIPHLPEEPLKIRVGLHSGKTPLPRFLFWFDLYTLAHSAVEERATYSVLLLDCTFLHAKSVWKPVSASLRAILEISCLCLI